MTSATRRPWSGLWDVDHIERRWRISTDRERTADESRLLLRSMLAEHGGPVTGGALSSVVPPRTEAWREAMGALIDGPLIVVGPGVKTGIALAVDNPREVGADRVANAIGAQRQFGAPVIVVDFGTATTVDLVGPDGSYRGGAIAPGLEVSADALVTHTAALRRVELSAPRSPVGRSTVEAIQSGLIYGYAGLVDGLVGRIMGDAGGELPGGGHGRPGRSDDRLHDDGDRPRTRPNPDRPRRGLRQKRVVSGEW